MATGALPGYEVKSAEPELRAALNVPELADAAIDGVAAFGSALAQQDLLSLAITGGVALPTRIKAADATIHHIQVNGKLIPKTLIEPLGEQAQTEPDAALRGKLLTLSGLLDFRQADFVNQLKAFSPPIAPPPPKGTAEGSAKRPEGTEGRQARRVIRATGFAGSQVSIRMEPVPAGRAFFVDSAQVDGFSGV